MQDEIETLARGAYDAYGAVTDHKNYQGLPMPTWDALPDKIRQAWLAAAQHVRNAVIVEKA
jgi:hypothetical protein